MRTASALNAGLRRALQQASDQPTPAARAARATSILSTLAQGSEDAAAIYRRAIEDLHGTGMSYGQISAELGISRGTVQKHAEHARRRAVTPGLIFAFRAQNGKWHPDLPESILPGGPYATGDGATIPPDRPSRFAGQRLVFAYEDKPSGRIADDSPGYAYYLTDYGRSRRSTRAVHDAIWESAPDPL
jgi:hypothetical protein